VESQKKADEKAKAEAARKVNETAKAEAIRKAEKAAKKAAGKPTCTPGYANVNREMVKVCTDAKLYFYAKNKGQAAIWIKVAQKKYGYPY